MPPVVCPRPDSAPAHWRALGTSGFSFRPEHWEAPRPKPRDAGGGGGPGSDRRNKAVPPPPASFPTTPAALGAQPPAEAWARAPRVPGQRRDGFRPRPAGGRAPRLSGKPGLDRGRYPRGRAGRAVLRGGVTVPLRDTHPREPQSCSWAPGWRLRAAPCCEGDGAAESRAGLGGGGRAGLGSPSRRPPRPQPWLLSSLPSLFGSCARSGRAQGRAERAGGPGRRGRRGCGKPGRGLGQGPETDGSSGPGPALPHPARSRAGQSRAPDDPTCSALVTPRPGPCHRAPRGAPPRAPAPTDPPAPVSPGAPMARPC